MFVCSLYGPVCFITTLKFLWKEFMTLGNSMLSWKKVHYILQSLSLNFLMVTLHTIVKLERNCHTLKFLLCHKSSLIHISIIQMHIYSGTFVCYKYRSLYLYFVNVSRYLFPTYVILSQHRDKIHGVQPCTFFAKKIWFKSNVSPYISKLSLK